MTYLVKEIFYTLQGEGQNAGRPAVFCRFSGCNLWTGREADRHRAVCQFCDTDFVGVGEDGEVVGTTLTPVYAALAAWEPLLGQPRRPATQAVASPKEAQRANPDPISRGRGLHVEPMVETVGIEPTSVIA